MYFSTQFLKAFFYCCSIVIIGCFVGIGCVQNDKVNTQNGKIVPATSDLEWMSKDTGRIFWTNRLEKRLREADNQGLTKITKGYPGVLSKDDQYTRVSLGDSIAMIMVWQSLDQKKENYTFLTYHDSLIMMRERKWISASYDPSAMESVYFLRSDTLFYVEEKKFALGPNERPVKMASLEAEPSKRGRGDLHRSVFLRWNPVLAFKKDLEEKQ